MKESPRREIITHRTEEPTSCQHPQTNWFHKSKIYRTQRSSVWWTQFSLNGTSPILRLIASGLKKRESAGPLTRRGTSPHSRTNNFHCTSPPDAFLHEAAPTPPSPLGGLTPSPSSHTAVSS